MLQVSDLLISFAQLLLEDGKLGVEVALEVQLDLPLDLGLHLRLLAGLLTHISLQSLLLLASLRLALSFHAQKVT